METEVENLQLASTLLHDVEGEMPEKQLESATTFVLGHGFCDTNYTPGFETQYHFSSAIASSWHKDLALSATRRDPKERSN